MRGVRRVKPGLARLSQPGTNPAMVPVTAAGPVTGGAASPPAVAVMPVAEVLLQPVSDQYATAAYRDLHPIWAPDGETILAHPAGTFGQLRMAGHP